MKNIFICTTVAAMLGACATPVAPPASVAPSAVVPHASVPQAAVVAAPLTQALPPYKDPANILYKERTVYFDFDSYTVKPLYDTAVAAHGKFLSSVPALKIRIEGNTDERGGAEYNLALGQKRAEALRKVLVVHGANASQIEAVSYGKEKPKAAGHDESAWSQNRRAEIVYP